jgi:hypothetical protein
VVSLGGGHDFFDSRGGMVTGDIRSGAGDTLRSGAGNNTLDGGADNDSRAKVRFGEAPRLSAEISTSYRADWRRNPTRTDIQLLAILEPLLCEVRRHNTA